MLDAEVTKLMQSKLSLSNDNSNPLRSIDIYWIDVQNKHKFSFNDKIYVSLFIIESLFCYVQDSFNVYLINSSNSSKFKGFTFCANFKFYFASSVSSLPYAPYISKSLI